MKDEITEPNTQTGGTPAPAEDEGNVPRRQFFGNLAGVVGAAAAIGAIGLTAKGQEQTQDKEIKSKILSRIQQQLNQDPGEEGMTYIKVDAHAKSGGYSKGGPAPVQPGES
jgi:hypothetical protein